MAHARTHHHLNREKCYFDGYDWTVLQYGKLFRIIRLFSDRKKRVSHACKLFIRSVFVCYRRLFICTCNIQKLKWHTCHNLLIILRFYISIWILFVWICKWSDCKKKNSNVKEKKVPNPIITFFHTYVFLTTLGNYIFKLTLNEFIDDNIHITLMARHGIWWGLLIFISHQIIGN